MMRDMLLGAFTEISGQAEQARVALRLTGSIAVQLRCPRYGTLVGPERRFADLDFVARKRDAGAVRDLMVNLGYVENREVFIASEGGRGIFDNPDSHVHLDVFFDRLEFCHVIDVRNRIDYDAPTLPLAELLLGKLQIVQINAKDVLDASILLLEHDLGIADGETINVSEIAARCADDWGLWRTLTGNLGKLKQFSDAGTMLGATERMRLTQQIASLQNAIDSAPKSLAWRLRAKVGDRVKWYRDVEEVDG
jgi:hypothetical protein